MKKDVNFLIATVKSSTFRQSGIALMGTFITGFLGLLFYILLPKSLGAHLFGMFSVSVAAASLISDIADVGTDTGLVQFVSKYYKSNNEKALRFLKLGLKTKFLISISVVLVGYFLAPFISENLLNKPELIHPLRFSMLGAVSLLFFSFSTHGLQAIQKFWTWSGLNIFTNLIRLIGLFVVSYFGLLTLSSSLILYIAVPMIGFFIGLVFMPRFWKIRNENSVSNEFFHYNKWVAIFTILAAISSRLDTFLTARYMDFSMVGIYAVATSLASVIPQFVSSIGTVVAPKMSSMSGDVYKTKVYMEKLNKLMLGLVLIGIPTGFLISRIIVSNLYGIEFAPSVYPLMILILAHSIFLLSVPYHSAVIYYFSYPKLFVWISAGNIVIMSLFGSILIMNYGYIGAAISVLISSIFNFLIPYFWVKRKFAIL